MPAHPETTWSEIFRDRGYLQLDTAKLASWMSENNAFFGMLRQLYAPGMTLLDIGSGPGRHSCGAAALGYRVVGVDRDADMVDVASRNAHEVVPAVDVTFHVADMEDIARVCPGQAFEVIVHGGVLEHLASADDMRAALQSQLRLAPDVIFDVPVKTVRNEALFGKDTVFRHVWEAAEWAEAVLAGFNVVTTEVELRENPGMTDDLVVWLRR